MYSKISQIRIAAFSVSSSFKFLFGALLALFQIACGGGSAGDVGVDKATNKWINNAGTYSACDSHNKVSATLTPTGSNQLFVSLKQEVFSQANCMGSQVGVLSPLTLIMTYQNTITSNVKGIGSSTTLQNLSIDTVSVSAPAQTINLTGSGVSGNCVYYLNGNICFNNLNYSAATMNAAIYVSSTVFSALTLNGLVWNADQPNLLKQ